MSVAIAFANQIEKMQAEEAIMMLAIANDPKPMYNIDPRKSRLNGLMDQFKSLIDSDARYGNEEPDLAGIEMLKSKLQSTQSMKKRA